MTMQINAANFESEVLKSEQPVLVDFFADWCGPCRSLAPIIEQMAEEYTGKAKVCKINVDDNQAIAQQFGVMSIPTLIFFKGGQKADQVVGFTPKAELIKKLDALL